MAKDKLDVVRQESVNDSEQALADLTHRYEREKAILLEENAKIISDIEAVSLKGEKLTFIAFLSY